MPPGGVHPIRLPAFVPGGQDALLFAGLKTRSTLRIFFMGGGPGPPRAPFPNARAYAAVSALTGLAELAANRVLNLLDAPLPPIPTGSPAMRNTIDAAREIGPCAPSHARRGDEHSVVSKRSPAARQFGRG